MSEPAASSRGGESAAPRRLITKEMLRRWLERRGPTAIKLGQFLALRPDLVPQEFADELLRLTDQVPFFSWREVHSIIAEDLRGDPSEIFAWLNPQPLAAGSLAQVHEARTHAGERVAVKVQRPGIRERVERDLSRARWITRLLDATGVIKIISAQEVIAEFRRWLEQELDLGRELQNLILMYHLDEGSKTSRVSKPFPELSGKRTVTSELIEGVPFTELLRLVREGSGERIEEMGLDRAQLAENLILTVLRQIFEDHYFHGDTHPGNLIALPDGVVGFVDFGLVNRLDETFRQGMAGYVSAVYSGDAERMYRSVIEVLTPGEQTNLEAFRRDFLAQTRELLGGGTTDPFLKPGERSPLARYMMAVMRSARQHNLRIPVGILSMYRSLLTAETVGSQLSSGANLATVGRRFFLRLQVRSTLDSLDPERTFALIAESLTLVRDLPGNLNRILADLADDRFLLRVRASETEDSRRLASLRTRMNTLATLTITVSLLIFASRQIPFLSSQAVSAGLLGLLGVMLLAIAILWRRLP